MYDTYDKSGKTGKARGYRGYKKGLQVKEVDTDFYDSQLKLAKSEDAERVDQYAKPGTSAKERSSESYEYSIPTSRYRSRRP